MKKQINIDECGGKLLLEVLKNTAEDVIVFVFEDCLAIVEAECSDDAAYLSDSYSYSSDTASRFGFPPEEMLRVGVIDQGHFDAITGRRKQREAELRENERNEFLRLKQIYEPGAT